MQRRTRRRPSSRPSVIANIAASTDESQSIVDDSVEQILEGFAKTDAAIIQDIMQATDPMARLARIIGYVAKHIPAGSGGQELIGALDELRYAIDPSLRPVPPDLMAKVWQSETLSRQQMQTLWGGNERH